MRTPPSARASRVAGVEFSLRVFNLFDREYETGGYMDYDLDGSLSPRFIPRGDAKRACSGARGVVKRFVRSSVETGAARRIGG